MLATLYWIRCEAKEWIPFVLLRAKVILNLVRSTLPTSRSTPLAAKFGIIKLGIMVQRSQMADRTRGTRRRLDRRDEGQEYAT